MFKYFLAAGMMTMCLTAMAGDKGNGGYSLVCRNTQGLITSAELLDIYEGRIIHKLEYPKDELVVDALLSVAEHRSMGNMAFNDKLQKEINQIRLNTVFIPEGNELELTEDAFPVIKKKGCQYEQLANYTNDGLLIVSQEIYDHLDNLNKASLIIHEAIYSIRRKALDENSSVKSRQLTAHIMSINGNQTLVDRMINDSLQRPDSSKRPCGLKGTISERIENCSFQKKPVKSLVLVTRTKDLKEVYKDLDTGLLWSDRLPSRVNYFVALRTCQDTTLSELGFLKAQWRLPTMKEYLDVSYRIISVLPNMYGDGEIYWFWTETADANFAHVFYGTDGSTGLEFNNSRKVGSVRCIASP
ncbi:MAG: DUF1566 domain-containing protein [Bacteriovoracaceae bacterium]|nr:DUF1566 domain-containing protein [Bacteriovoracaceae bacterium]